MTDMSDPAQYRAILREAREAREAFEPDDDTLHEAGGGAGLDGIDVQVVAADGRGDIGAGAVLARFGDRIDELGESVAAVATRWRDSLQDRLPDDPRERWRMSTVSMEFGVNLEASSGVVICHGKTAATFKVAITWSARDTPSP